MSALSAAAYEASTEARRAPAFDPNTVQRVKDAILAAAKEVTPAGIKVEVVEEDEDVLLVREITEEPQNEFRASVVVPAPVDLVKLTVKLNP